MLSSQIPLFHRLDLSKLSYNFANMDPSRILKAWSLLMQTFDEHTHDDELVLNKSGLADLLKKEFPGEPKDKAEVENLFSSLDADRDGVVTFKEFVAIVADFDLMFSA